MGLDDVRAAALIAKGYTGHIMDMLKQFFLANGATALSIPDAEREFLIAAGAIPAHQNDMWLELLGNLGYTGSLIDRMYAFWLDGGNLSQQLLYDTFTDTLNSYLTAHTPDVGGPWALIKNGDINAYQIKDDGVYKNTNPTYASGYSPVISDIGLATGFRINVKGRMPSTAAGVGIVFRAQTPSAGNPTFMLANIQYFTMAIYFFNGSSFVNLASASNPDAFDNSWFDLSLEVQGDDISFYKNDVPIVQLTSAQNNTETRVGLAGYSTQANSRWDDYEVLV